MRFKNANSDQIITTEISARNFFVQKNVLKPYFIVFFDKQCFKKANLDQIITPEKAKLGPDNNSTACTYIYIYVYIYICVYCVQFRGVFPIIGNGFTNAPVFALCWNSSDNKKMCFPLVKPFHPPESLSENGHCPAHIQCVQKRGAYVSQHKRPILERIHAPHFSMLRFPMFRALLSWTLKSAKPLFHSVLSPF